MTVEEHNYLGRLGECIAQVLLEEHPTPQEFIATHDTKYFWCICNTRTINRKYELNSSAIV